MIIDEILLQVFLVLVMRLGKVKSYLIGITTNTRDSFTRWMEVSSFIPRVWDYEIGQKYRIGIRLDPRLSSFSFSKLLFTKLWEVLFVGSCFDFGWFSSVKKVTLCVYESIGFKRIEQSFLKFLRAKSCSKLSIRGSFCMTYVFSRLG